MAGKYRHGRRGRVLCGEELYRHHCRRGFRQGVQHKRVGREIAQGACVACAQREHRGDQGKIACGYRRGGRKIRPRHPLKILRGLGQFVFACRSASIHGEYTLFRQGRKGRKKALDRSVARLRAAGRHTAKIARRSQHVRHVVRGFVRTRSCDLCGGDRREIVSLSRLPRRRDRCGRRVERRQMGCVRDQIGGEPN